MASNFIKRAITGVLFVAILVGCILYTSFSFGILFIIISALTIYEFGQLVNMRADGVNVNKTIIMLGGAYLFLAVMGICIDAADSKIFIPYVLLLLYLMISELYLKKENPVLRDYLLKQQEQNQTLIRQLSDHSSEKAAQRLCELKEKEAVLESALARFHTM